MRWFIAFLLVCLLPSCGDDAIHFTSPQPPDSKDLSSFPKRYRGTYFSLADSSTLIIAEKTVIREYDFNFRLRKADMDTTFSLIGDSLLVKKDERDTFRLSTISDSLLTFRVTNRDTFFVLPGFCRLRKMKGYLFLNTNCGDSCWTVQKMSLQKGHLEIGSLQSPDDINALDNLAEYSTDTAWVSLNRSYTTSQKDFRQFVKQSGFRDTERFLKTKQLP